MHGDVDVAREQCPLDLFGENTASAEAEVNGNASITLNSRYILDALQAFDGEKIQINVNGKLDPCILTDPKDASYLHVVMPVKS
mgnify:CR=1 FL=1